MTRGDGDTDIVCALIMRIYNPINCKYIYIDTVEVVSYVWYLVLLACKKNYFQAIAI